MSAALSPQGVNLVSTGFAFTKLPRQRELGTTRLAFIRCLVLERVASTCLRRLPPAV